MEFWVFSTDFRISSANFRALGQIMRHTKSGSLQRGITDPTKALTNSLQGRVVSGVHARYIVNGLQSLRVLSGSMCSLSSKFTARSIYFAPIAASKSSNIDSGQFCVSTTLLACSDVLAQNDGQCSTALFEPCSGKISCLMIPPPEGNHRDSNGRPAGKFKQNAAVSAPRSQKRC